MRPTSHQNGRGCRAGVETKMRGKWIGAAASGLLLMATTGTANAAEAGYGYAYTPCGDGVVLHSPTSLYDSDTFVFVSISFSDRSSGHLVEPPITVTVDSITNNQSAAGSTFTAGPGGASAFTDASGVGNTGNAQAGG